MYLNEHYFNRLFNFLEGNRIKYKFSSTSEYSRSDGILKIPTVKFKNLKSDWIISTRNPDRICVIIMGSETNIIYIDLTKEELTSEGIRPHGNWEIPKKEDFNDEEIWNFITRLVFLENNAIDFVLSLAKEYG